MGSSYVSFTFQISAASVWYRCAQITISNKCPQFLWPPPLVISGSLGSSHPASGQVPLSLYDILCPELKGVCTASGSLMSASEALPAQSLKCTNAWKHSCVGSMEKGYLPFCLLGKKSFHLDSEVSQRLLEAAPQSSGPQHLCPQGSPKRLDLLLHCSLFLSVSLWTRTFTKTQTKQNRKYFSLPYQKKKKKSKATHLWNQANNCS